MIGIRIGSTAHIIHFFRENTVMKIMNTGRIPTQISRYEPK
jgi:hypothetical protein